MAIGTNNTIDGPFLPNGIATEFPFTFTALSTADVEVVSVSSAGVETTVSSALYDVTLGQTSGGTVSFASAPTGDPLYIVSTPSFIEGPEFESGSPYVASAHNTGFDRDIIRDQVLRDTAGRGVKVPLGETGLSLPSAATRASRVFGFDSLGRPDALTPSSLSIKGDPGSAGEGYATRAALADTTASNLDDAYLAEPGREGKFIWSIADLSAQVTNDPAQGIYIAPASDTNGASGAWVRQYDDSGIWVNWFGDLVFDDNSTSARTTNTATIQAAYNWASKNEVYIVRFPEGRLHANTIYLCYDATLNPGFNSTSDNLLRRDGLFRTQGAGCLSVKNARDYASTNVYGTVLVLHGDGVVVSLTSGTPFPSRRSEFHDITLVGDSAMSGDYVIDSLGCPFLSLDHATVVQLKTTGNGARLYNAWGLTTRRAILIGTGSSHTGDCIHAGGTISAGSFMLEGFTIIDGFRDNFVWQTGVWRVLSFDNAWIQAANRYGIHIEGGAIDVLVVNRCHFEGQSRTTDVKIAAGTVRHLVHKSNYHLCGTNADASHLSGPVLDIAGIEDLTVESNACFRIRGTFCNIDDVTNGESPGYANHNTFINDSTSLTGTHFLFTGVLPEMNDNAWTGAGVGLEGASALRLYDVSAGNHPPVYGDKRSATLAATNFSFGLPTVTTGQSGSLDLNITASGVQDVTNTANSSVALPTHASVDLTNGRVFLIRNNSASVGFINVRYGSGGTTLKQLLAGEYALFVFDRAAQTYNVFEQPLAQVAAIADLNQTISDPPTQVQVQAISDKVDDLLAKWRAQGGLAT